MKATKILLVELFLSAFVLGLGYLMFKDFRVLGVFLIASPFLLWLFMNKVYPYTFKYHLRKKLFGEQAVANEKDDFKLKTTTSKVLFFIFMALLIAVGISIIFDFWNLAAELQ